MSCVQETVSILTVKVSILFQGSMGSIACIAWKGDTLVLGDVDGNLNFWDLKARLSR